MVLKYLPQIFQWSTLLKNEKLTVFNRRMGITKTIGNLRYNIPSAICSNTELNADQMSLVRWEMTLRRFKNGLDFSMGYIEKRHIKWFNDCRSIGSVDYGAALAVKQNKSGWNLQFCNEGLKTKIEDEKVDTIIAENDKFVLELDFKKQECIALRNGIPLGILSKDLPRGPIYPAASIGTKGTSLETTLFVIS